ncbi:Rossmann-like domain protein [Legionella birminghamensis]|uniref:Rossmann-like domain protein n=1 Tax=Legionella birminghamensis TaxID=28083 RepID=A0A378IEV3_9GAMM|nr:Rossmann-like and DUF2520 domain-containing protein [Legionella birminghamensis]KTC68794.1 Rossmann-like domain protein [Legionella birminghamensis]STX33265.1 Uncharacterized conserved protein [Legionella birminghamensis]
MDFNLIGSGRLGTQLAYALIHSGKGKLLSVFNRHFSSTEESIRILGAGTAISDLRKLAPANLHFITTPDAAITHIVQQLQEAGPVLKGSVVVHCSGVLSSEVLAPLHALGCYIVCLHPLKPFPRQLPDAEIFEGCYCSIEGDSEAIDILSPLFLNLGARLFTIQPEQKMLYHAAAAIASNYLVTLADVAGKCMQQAGVGDDLAKEVIVSLMQASLSNISKADSSAEALTGPIARGDIQTVKQHLQAISDPLVQALYRKAGLATLEFASLNEQKKQDLRSLLEI